MTNQEEMMPIAQQVAVERHMMIALSHLSDAQELLTKADLHEAAFRLDQAKKVIIQELEYRRQQRERDQNELARRRQRVQDDTR